MGDSSSDIFADSLLKSPSPPNFLTMDHDMTAALICPPTTCSLLTHAVPVNTTPWITSFPSSVPLHCPLPSKSLTVPNLPLAGPLLHRSTSLVSDISSACLYRAPISTHLGLLTIAVPLPILPLSIVPPVSVSRASHTALQASRRYRRAIRRARASTVSSKILHSVQRDFLDLEDGRAHAGSKRVRNRQAVANCWSRKMAKLSALAAESETLVVENRRMSALLAQLGSDEFNVACFENFKRPQMFE